MGERTGIAWTDSTWNPVRGCSRVSEGCRNCYAERNAGRFGGKGRPFEGFVKYRSKVSGLTYDNPKAAGTAEALWTGKVALVEKALLLPLKWREPRRIFVNSMSDLFHESLHEDDIARVFAVMALAERHTFQVLTKRPHRMRHLLNQRGDHPPASFLSLVGARCEQYAETVERLSPGAMMGFDAWWQGIEERGYFPNVHLGVSTEDQRTADERIPLLLQTPAAVRFVSAEPLLGAVDLRFRGRDCTCTGTCRGRSGLGQGWRCVMDSRPEWGPEGQNGLRPLKERGIDWVITGGESGPGARPCNIAWIRSIVQQCKAAGVPSFVKQLGAHVRDRNDAGFLGDIETGWPAHVDEEDRVEEDPSDTGYQGAPVRIRLRDRKGADPAEWPEDLRVQEFPR